MAVFVKPLICFYQDDQYIHSSNYVLHSCRPEQSVTEFLTEMEEHFKKDLKIVQVNFEFEHGSLFEGKKELYPSAKASVFVLNKFEILNQKQLMEKIPSTLNPLSHEFKSLEEKESFIGKVEQIKKEIAAGRLYQVNLTAPMVSPSRYNAEKIFKNYFEKFPGQYKAMLPLPEYDLISFSPELFLKKLQQKLRTQPIKGSSDNAETLMASTKDDAELSMIVDLLRNDLNKLSETNSSVVKSHRALMKLGYIQHTYSDIEINTEKNLPEILAAVFPGGSISGCPKLESLKVISELETFKRQAYTGSIGWWKENNFCLNIAIRTFMLHKGQLYYHAGCGIVYDSVPEKEWNEFVLKTGKLL